MTPGAATTAATSGPTRRPRSARPRTRTPPPWTKAHQHLPAAASRPARRATSTSSSAVRALAALAEGRSSLPPEVATDIRNAADIATQAHRERLVEQAEVGLRRLRAGPLPGCAPGHQAGGRRGPQRRRGPGVGRAGGLPLRSLARGRRGTSGLRQPERLDRAPARAHGLPARAAQAEEGGRALDRAPPELARPRRPGRGSHRGGRLAGRHGRPQRGHRHAGHRRRLQGAAQPRPTGTCASGTCWPTCTSGRATSPGPASTSSGYCQSDPQAYDVTDRLRQPRPAAPLGPEGPAKKPAKKPSPS